MRRTRKSIYRDDQSVWRSLQDADFVRRHCLPDAFPHLVDFRFYIVSRCEFSSIDTEKILHSFQTHPCFVDHQWHNVRCLHDDENWERHVFSSELHPTPLLDPPTYVVYSPAALNPLIRLQSLSP
jgi:hypothetical protein